MGAVEEVGRDCDDGCRDGGTLSMFFVQEEGTAGSFQGVLDVILFTGVCSAHLHRSRESLLVYA